MPKLVLSSMPQHTVVEAVYQKLPDQGILCQSDTGYVYVKVADDIIYRLFPLIDIPTKQLPDYFSNSTNNVGAHISVIYEAELQENRTIAGLGKTIYFQKIGICKARLNAKNYVVLMVKALELENLRVQHGLSAKPIYQGFEVEFHITIASYSA